MKKYYMFLVLIAIHGNSSNAAEVMHRSPSRNMFSSNDSHQLRKFSNHSFSEITVDFSEFYNKDPYELEELHQSFFKEGKFKESAKALIGSAINGDSENMDYLLKIDPKFVTYIYGKDLDKTVGLIEKLSEKLEKQFKIVNSSPKLLKSLDSNIQHESLPKKK